MDPNQKLSRECVYDLDRELVWEAKVLVRGLAGLEQHDRRRVRCQIQAGDGQE
jgi:hypothetical protein